MPYPFSALVGQDEMRSALLIAAIDRSVGGVLILGDRGSGKSTSVRALAALLPSHAVVSGCRFGCDPAGRAAWCDECVARGAAGVMESALVPVPVVDLPLGATEDRVVGGLDLQRALTTGERVLEPGLLARANRGFLYIDEVNLLEDHLIDLLLDVAASGENIVERDGLSLRHPARFVLIGSGNPEEGELRPQLLDRFGLCVEVTTPDDIAARVEIVRRRVAYDRDPAGFAAYWAEADAVTRDTIAAARGRLATVVVPEAALVDAATLCRRLGTDGLRGELTLIRAARALAAFDGTLAVGREELRRAAPAALRHRLRRDPLDETVAGARVEQAVAEVFA